MNSKRHFFPTVFTSLIVNEDPMDPFPALHHPPRLGNTQPALACHSQFLAKLPTLALQMYKRPSDHLTAQWTSP